MDVAVGWPGHQHDCILREVGDLDIKQHRCEDGILRDNNIHSSEPIVSVYGVHHEATVCHCQLTALPQCGVVVASQNVQLR